MNIKDLKNRAKKQRNDVIVVGDYEFTVKLPSEVDILNLSIIQDRKDEEIVYETALTLRSITGYKGIKVKDVLYEYTEEEAEIEIDFDQYLLEEFFGSHQSVFLEVFSQLSKKIIEQRKKLEEQKKT